MDDERLKKLRAELEKARRKRDEWNDRVKVLEKRYMEAEKTCGHGIVQAAHLTPEQLGELIRKLNAGMLLETSSFEKEEEENE